MNGEMKNAKIMLLAFVTLFLLSGCKDDRHYEEVEKKALSYYKEKYGLKDVEITDSCKAGNSGLFGYLDVKDRAYEMSDGHSVYWNEYGQYFADDRQAAAIKEDFETQIFQPLIAPENVRAGDFDLNRTAMETYDACVFTEYYDGDIRSFLEKEKPQPYHCRITISGKEGFDHEAYTKKIYEDLDPCLSGMIEVIIVEEGSGLFEQSDDLYIRNGDPGIIATASLYFDDQICWRRQVYIEILDGVFITSSEANFDFEEGDVRLVEAGSAQEFQQILDHSYYSLPVDAEENKKGGYLVHDQRHEERYVLDDPDAPYYRLELSERVRQALKDDRFSVYAYMDEGKETPLYVRYGYSPSSAWKLFTFCENDKAVKYDTLHPDNLYYFGKFHREGFPEGS